MLPACGLQSLHRLTLVGGPLAKTLKGRRSPPDDPPHREILEQSIELVVRGDVDDEGARAERGLWNGGRLFGYDLNPDRKGFPCRTRRRQWE